jgi:formate-dependent nitrite reductase membrane component NrfD
VTVRRDRYARFMLAAEIWHWWIGVILLIVGIASVFALVAGYLKDVSSQRYPSKRERDTEASR